MTPEELAELKRLAEAANEDTVAWYSEREFQSGFTLWQADAAYAHAADPATILRLIAHIEELEERLDEAEGDLVALDEELSRLNEEMADDALAALSAPSAGGSDE